MRASILFLCAALLAEHMLHNVNLQDNICVHLINTLDALYHHRLYRGPEHDGRKRYATAYDLVKRQLYKFIYWTLFKGLVFFQKICYEKEQLSLAKKESIRLI